MERTVTRNSNDEAHSTAKKYGLFGGHPRNEGRSDPNSWKFIELEKSVQQPCSCNSTKLSLRDYNAQVGEIMLGINVMNKEIELVMLSRAES